MADLRKQADVNDATEDEQWRPVVGYEGLYEVSGLGRVRSLARQVAYGRIRGRILKAEPGKNGYPRVNLWKNGRSRQHYVHHLVLAAFASPCPEGQETRHLDGDPCNNALANLVYGTSSENNYDIVRHGRHHAVRKTHCKHGHEFTPENIYINSASGARQCRACAIQRARGRRRGE